MYSHSAGRLLLKPLLSAAFSKYAGKFLNTWISALLVKPFIRHENMDMSDYREEDYTSFNDFFTRKVKEGFRPLTGDRNTLVSPCDGRISVYPISDKTIFSIKHTEYTLRTLLRSRRLADRYKNGHAFVIRLTVNDYHRYIYAANGRKSKNYHIQGLYHTVNPVANDLAPIYKENTREYTVIHTKEFGDIIQMEVGALMVGKITNHDEDADVCRGEEKGYFEFGGSTVVVFVKQNRLEIREDLIKNTADGYETKILQGDALGVK